MSVADSAAAAHKGQRVVPQHPPQLLQLLPVVAAVVACKEAERFAAQDMRRPAVRVVV